MKNFFITLWNGIKEFVRWLKSVLEDPNKPKNLSSKRLQSFIALGAAITIGDQSGPIELVVALLGYAAALQGITAFQK